MFRENRRFLAFVRISCQIFGHWTLSPDAPKWKRLLLDIWYNMQFMNELYGMVAIVHGFICCFEGVNQVIKSSLDIVFMLETLYNSVYVRWKREQFRRSATEMEEFFLTTSCVNLIRPRMICRVLTATYLIGGVLFIVVPLFSTKQRTPLDTVYFTVPRNIFWGQVFIYTVNVIQIINAASALFLDMLMVLIMWHVACKFSILGNRFKILSEKKLKLWIKEHQDALRYVEKINSMLAPLAMKSMFAVAFDIIISGLITSRNLNLVELIKFSLITFFSGVRFLACSWVADTMTEKAYNIGWKIYVSPWISTSPRTQRMAVTILQRTQKPVAIHRAGFLPAWTLEFCARAMYTIGTSLTTLRAVIRV